MIRAFTLMLAGLSLAACGLDVTSPGTDLEGLPGGLEVEFTVEPGEVGQHGAFSLRLRIKNTTNETIRISTSSSCLALPHVRRDGKRAPFRGTNFACLAVATTHHFEPGEIDERVWTLQATLDAQGPEEIDGAPAPKGGYVAGVTFGGSSMPGILPTIERSLRVR